MARRRVWALHGGRVEGCKAELPVVIPVPITEFYIDRESDEWANARSQKFVQKRVLFSLEIF